MFLYSVKSKAPATLFTSLAITSVEHFEHTLDKLLKEHTISRNSNNYTTVTAQDGKVTILYNKHIAAIAYSEQKEEVLSVLTDVLLQKNVVTVAESAFKKIKENSDHISYLDNLNTGTLNFNKGAVVAMAKLKIDGVSLPAAAHAAQNLQSCLRLWVDVDLHPLLAGKTWSIGTHTIHADSILKYYHNVAQLEVGGTVMQQDSVITYGYNDDFEKVQKVEVRETPVPQIVAFVKADGELYNYLHRQGIFNADSGIVNRSVFPLYQLYVSKKPEAIRVSTLKVSASETGIVTDPAFAGLEIDFDKLVKEHRLPVAGKYLQPLKSMSVKATAVKSDQATINLSLHFDNARTNAAVLLLRLAE